MLFFTSNLQANKNKTEEHHIKRNGGEEWKKCKYLGTLLDTHEDIKRRKQLANAAFIQYKEILTSKKIELKIRLRLFNAYISSVFLYNSELWTLTKTQENKIDTSEISSEENPKHTLAVHNQQRKTTRNYL